MSGGVRQEVEAMALLRGMFEHFDVHGVPPEVSAYFREADRILHTRATPTPPIEGRDADVERVAEAMWKVSPYHGGTAWDHVSMRRYGGTCETRELFLTFARAALQALGERG